MQDIATLYTAAINHIRVAKTCRSLEISRKGFKKHVPEKTQNWHMCWGRDKWIAFDMLPAKYRKEINEDLNDPDAALDFYVEVWKADVAAAVYMVDQIITMEGNAEALSSIPEMFRTLKDDEINAIMQLKAERIKVMQEEERIEAEKQNMSHKKSRNIRIPRYRNTESYGLRMGNEVQPLEGVTQNITRLRLPPHKMRELLPKKQVAEVVRYAGPVVKINNTQHDNKSNDSEPPLKFHPVMGKRGKNS